MLIIIEICINNLKNKEVLNMVLHMNIEDNQVHIHNTIKCNINKDNRAQIIEIQIREDLKILKTLNKDSKEAENNIDNKVHNHIIKINNHKIKGLTKIWQGKKVQIESKQFSNKRYQNLLIISNRKD